MFPFSFTKQIIKPLKGDPQWITGVLKARLTTALEKVGASNIKVDDSQISFAGQGFLAFRRRLLFTVSWGRVVIAHKDDQLVISYHLGLIGLLIFVSLVAGLIGLGLNTFLKMPTETSVSLTCFSWVAVFGLNFIATVVDFHRFMAGQIRDFVNFAMGVGW